MKHIKLAIHIWFYQVLYSLKFQGHLVFCTNFTCISK